MLFFSIFAEANDVVASESQRVLCAQPLTETFPHVRSLMRDYILRWRFCMADIARRRV
jgi:hypothetical protein